MADEEDPEASAQLQESDYEIPGIPDDSASGTLDTSKTSSKISKLQSLISTILQNGSPSASQVVPPLQQTPSAASSKRSKQEEPSVLEEASEIQEEPKKSQELSLNGKKTSLDQLSKDTSRISQKPRLHRHCQRRFRELIGKREIKREELTKQQCVLKQRLDILECSMPAVMVWNIWRMSQGSCVPNLKQVLEKQFQGPASGEVYCPSTPSRHFDCRVREVEADRKQAQKRVEEARALWAEKEAALVEKSKRLEEARKAQIQIRENIEKLTVEAQKLREAASKATDDGACVSGECRVIECKKKWLEKVPSGASIKSTDIECLEELQHLAMTELCMKRQIAELERREEAYMRTLQQADELWAKLQCDATSTMSTLQEQLDVKTSANQQMADRIVQLEDALEELRKRLATCRSQLEKFMSIDKIEALIGRDDDFADVFDREVDAEAAVSEKDTLAKPDVDEAESEIKPDVDEAESEMKPDVADLATGVYRTDLVSVDDAQLGIKPEDFALEKQKVDEAMEYLASYGSLSELFAEDDYICPPDFACNDVVLTETGLTEEELTALNEGRVTAEMLLKDSQRESYAEEQVEFGAVPGAMMRMMKQTEHLESARKLAEEGREEVDASVGEIEDEQKMVIGELKETEIDAAQEASVGASVLEDEIVDQTTIKTEPEDYVSVQDGASNILVPLNELVTWQGNVETIRETVVKCPDCVVVKEDADVMAEAMAKYTGIKVKEVIDEQEEEKRKPVSEVEEAEIIAAELQEEVVEEATASIFEEVKEVEDSEEKTTQVVETEAPVSKEPSRASVPEVIPSVEDEVPHFAEEPAPLPAEGLAPSAEKEAPVAEGKDYDKKADEELIATDITPDIVKEKSVTTVEAEEIKEAPVEPTEPAKDTKIPELVAEVKSDAGRGVEEVQMEKGAPEQTVEAQAISPDGEQIAEVLTTRGKDEPDVAEVEMITEREQEVRKEEETKSQLLPERDEAVTAEKKEIEVDLLPEKVAPKQKESVAEALPEEGKEIAAEALAIPDEEKRVELVPEEEEISKKEAIIESVKGKEEMPTEEAVTETAPEKEEEEAVTEAAPDKEEEEAVTEAAPEKEEEEEVTETAPEKEEEEAVTEPVPEEEEEAVAESVPEKEEEAVTEPVPEEEEEAVTEVVPEEEEEAVTVVPEKEEEAVTELAPEEEEEVEVEILEEAEPTDEREVEEVAPDEAEEVAVEVLPEVEVEDEEPALEVAVVPVEEVADEEEKVEVLPEEVEEVPVETDVEVEIAVVHVEEVCLLGAPMVEAAVSEEALPCVCVPAPEEPEESDVSEISVPEGTYELPCVCSSISEKPVSEVPKSEKAHEFPCICCTIREEPVPKATKATVTEEICELPCTCFTVPEPAPKVSRPPVLEEIHEVPCVCCSIPEEPVPKLSKAPDPKERHEAPCDCFPKPEEPAPKLSRAPAPEEIRKPPCVCSKSEISKAPDPEEIRTLPCSCSTKSEISKAPDPEEIRTLPCSCSSKSEISKAPDPEEMRTLPCACSKSEISKAPDPEETRKLPCVCSSIPEEVTKLLEDPEETCKLPSVRSSKSEESETPEVPIIVPFIYSIPVIADYQHEPSTKIEITQTEFTKTVEAMQVVTQTVSDTGTQTPLNRLLRRSHHPKIITVTRPADPEVDVLSQLSRRLKPVADPSLVTTTAASSQTQKSGFLQSRSVSTKGSSGLRISEILQSLRAEVAHLKSDPEEELKSVNYGRKQEAATMKCNCCMCGKDMPAVEPRTRDPKQSSTVFRFQPPRKDLPGVDQGVQYDTICPRCKIIKLQEALRSQESLKQESKRSTCDKEVCASAPKSIPFHRLKKKIDQSVTARIPRPCSKVEKLSKRDKVDPEKEVQEIMPATKPADKESLMQCVCEMDTGTTSRTHCACGDPD